MAVAASLNVLLGARTEQFQQDCKRAEGIYKGTYARMKGEYDRGSGQLFGGFFNKSASSLKPLAMALGATGLGASFALGYEGMSKLRDIGGEFLRDLGTSSRIWMTMMSADGLDRISSQMAKVNSFVREFQNETKKINDQTAMSQMDGLMLITAKAVAERRALDRDLKKLASDMNQAPEWNDVPPGMKASLLEHRMNAGIDAINARMEEAKATFLGNQAVQHLQLQGKSQEALALAAENAFKRRSNAIVEWAKLMKQWMPQSAAAIDQATKKLQEMSQTQMDLEKGAALANLLQGLHERQGAAGRTAIQQAAVDAAKLGATAPQIEAVQRAMRLIEDRTSARSMRESGAFLSPVERIQKEMLDLERMYGVEAITKNEFNRGMLAKGLALRDALGMGQVLPRAGAVERMFSFDVPGAEKADDPLKNLVTLQEQQMEQDRKLAKQLVDKLGKVVKF